MIREKQGRCKQIKNTDVDVKQIKTQEYVLCKKNISNAIIKTFKNRPATDQIEQRCRRHRHINIQTALKLHPSCLLPRSI